MSAPLNERLTTLARVMDEKSRIGNLLGIAEMHLRDATTIRDVLAALAAKDAEIARLREAAAQDREVLASLVDTLTEISFDGGDFDGASIQDDLTRLGILHQTEFDPARHGEDFDGEPGDIYFEFTPYGQSLIRVAIEKRRALAASVEREPAEGGE